jgi:hypothetical protein
MGLKEKEREREGERARDGHIGVKNIRTSKSVISEFSYGSTI